MSGLAALRGRRPRSAIAGRADLPRARRREAAPPGRGRHQPARAGRAASAARRATADRVVATCTDEVRELRRAGRCRGRASTSCPCGVDLELFRPDGPARRATGRPRLLVVGRLVPRKGVDDVIAALPRLPERRAGRRRRRRRGRRCARDPEARRLARWPPSWASPTGSAASARCRTPNCPALIRSADVVAVPALVRAVRHRAARGDGVRCAGRRHRGRRPARHRRRRRRPACSCRRATRPASPRRVVDCSANGARARRSARGRRRGHAALRLGEIAAATERTLPARGSRRPAAP